MEIFGDNRADNGKLGVRRGGAESLNCQSGSDVEERGRRGGGHAEDVGGLAGDALEVECGERGGGGSVLYIERLIEFKALRRAGRVPGEGGVRRYTAPLEDCQIRALRVGRRVIRIDGERFCGKIAAGRRADQRSRIDFVRVYLVKAYRGSPYVNRVV